MYGEGISQTGELIDIGVEENIVEKSGSWFSFGNERIGQGRENAKQYLLENPLVFKELQARVREKFGLAPSVAPEAEPQKNGK
jgi:recombination protein RecA